MDNTEPKDVAAQSFSVSKKRQLEEDHTPLWIKIFGGSILSIAFLCVITLTGYIVSNLNSIQIQVNTINADMISKKDFAGQSKLIWDGIKLESDSTAELKERINTLEQVARDRQLWTDKCEVKLTDSAKAMESANKEIAALKERANAVEAQLNQFREEHRQLQKDLQLLRERVAAIEGKAGEKKN